MSLKPSYRGESLATLIGDALALRWGGDVARFASFAKVPPVTVTALCSGSLAAEHIKPAILHRIATRLGLDYVMVMERAGHLIRSDKPTGQVGETDQEKAGAP